MLWWNFLVNKKTICQQSFKWEDQVSCLDQTQALSFNTMILKSYNSILLLQIFWSNSTLLFLSCLDMIKSILKTGKKKLTCHQLIQPNWRHMKREAPIIRDRLIMLDYGRRHLNWWKGSHKQLQLKPAFYFKM